MQTVILLAALSLLVVALGLVGAKRLHALRLFWDYPQLRKEVAHLKRFLQATTFRDGDDLVLSGNLHGRRTVIRFSRNENLPGMILHMEAPATFDLDVGARSVEWLEEGKPLQTGDEHFDKAWKLQSTEPELGHLFLKDKRVLRGLLKLCCSYATVLHVEHGALELHEATVPESSPGRHIVEHLQTMYELGLRMASMPGADRVKLEHVPPPRPTTQVFTAVLASIAVCAAIALLANFEGAKRMAAAASGYEGSPQGIPAPEAAHIPNLRGWRLSGSPDFDADLVQWLRGNSVQPDGRVDGDFSGSGTSVDHAYLLINAEHSYRVVVLGGDDVLFDKTFPELACFAKVPKTSMRDIRIDSGSRASGGSDGILLIRNGKDAHSAIVLSFRGKSVVTAVPQDFKEIVLESPDASPASIDR